MMSCLVSRGSRFDTGWRLTNSQVAQRQSVRLLTEGSRFRNSPCEQQMVSYDLIEIIPSLPIQSDVVLMVKRHAVNVKDGDSNSSVGAKNNLI